MMKVEILKLLQAHNNVANGIIIPIAIKEYVDKIIQYATVVPFWSQGHLEGFIAYYGNDEAMEYAFLTMILISKDFQGRGIGKLLLEFSIKDLTKRGFKNYGLEVLKSNENAKRLYERLGFITKETRGELWYMEKTLK